MSARTTDEKSLKRSSSDRTPRISTQSMRTMRSLAAAAPAAAEREKSPGSPSGRSMTPAGTGRKGLRKVHTAPGSGEASMRPLAARELRLEGHGSRILRSRWSPNGKLIATASADGTARIWSAQTGVCRITFRRHTSPVLDVTWSKDGRRVATASEDTSVRVWTVSNGSCFAYLKGHRGAVVGVDFSPDGARLASVSLDGTMRLWDIAAGRCLDVFEVIPAAPAKDSFALAGVEYCRDGERVMVTCSDRTARVFTTPPDTTEDRIRAAEERAKVATQQLKEALAAKERAAKDAEGVEGALRSEVATLEEALASSREATAMEEKAHEATEAERKELERDLKAEKEEREKWEQIAGERGESVEDLRAELEQETERRRKAEWHGRLETMRANLAEKKHDEALASLRDVNAQVEALRDLDMEFSDKLEKETDAEVGEGGWEAEVPAPEEKETAQAEDGKEE